MYESRSEKLSFLSQCLLVFCCSGVPVCSGFCDSWFEACKTDQICVENVLEDYNFTVHGENFCPKDKNCTTYEVMYGNGKNLCEKMWAGSYNYTEANANYSNCFMMDGSKPTPATPKPTPATPKPTPATPKPTVGSKGFTDSASSLLVIVLVMAIMIKY